MKAEGSAAAITPCVIRPLRTLAELRACVRLQEEVLGVALQRGSSRVPPQGESAARELVRAPDAISYYVLRAVRESVEPNEPEHATMQRSP
jgi:hypothetical protein